MIINVEVYKLPFGNHNREQVKVSDKCLDNYEAIQRCKGILTAETLSNDTVSQTIETPEGDFDIVLTEGVTVTGAKKHNIVIALEATIALEGMILRFDEKKCLEWIENLRSN